MVVIECPPVEMNDDLTKLYDVITDDPEVEIETQYFIEPTEIKDKKVKPKYSEFKHVIEIDTKYVGGYELTAYIETGNPCADGVYPRINHTAACNDPALWHKWIHIEGYGDYYVHDTGGMANNVIDIFMSSYDEAINFGRQYGEVYIIDMD